MRQKFLTTLRHKAKDTLGGFVLNTARSKKEGVVSCLG